MAIKCPKCQTENPPESKFCMECATPLTDPKEISISQTRTLQTPSEGLTRGTLFADRYEIIEKLGEGGMGTVYRVEDTKVGEEVALKLINPLVSSDSKTIERFRNELKFARKIRHKNVCQMFDLGEDEGTHFITMEYVAGEDLKSLLRRTGKLTIEMALRIVKQVSEGLAEAHRLGIVHRDLKPSNIMIDKEGHSRIMDFGIARSREAKGLTGAGLVIGTPEYMSPEQAEGKEADSRSDIYSLGVILFEMLTGQRPFEGDSALGIAMKHKSEEPQEPRLLNPNIPESINELVLKCLKKNPAERYQNAEEIVTELASLDLKISDIKTRGKQKSGLISKEITVSISLRKFLFPAIILFVLVIAALFIWHPWRKESLKVVSSDKPTVAIVYFKNHTGNREIDDWEENFPCYLMDDLGESKLITVLNPTKMYSILQELDLLNAEGYSESELRKICEKGHASHILTGRIWKSESSYRVGIQLQKADTLENLGEEEVQGDLENSPDEMVDLLSPKIKDLFGLSAVEVANDYDRDIGDIRPRSPEAYEFYLQGSRALEMESDVEKAIGFFNQALEIEPFRWGLIQLGICYANKGIPKESNEYFEKARTFPGDMTLRESNYIKAYSNINSEKTLDIALEAFKEILKVYPDDFIANDNLGSISYFLEEWEDAIKYYGHLWEIGDLNSMYPYLFLSNAYCAVGLYEKALECLKYFRDNVPDNIWIRSFLIGVYICQKNYDLALLEFERLPSSNPSDLYAVGRYWYVKDDFIRAEESFENLKECQDLGSRTVAFEYLYYTYLVQGRYTEAQIRLSNGMDFAESNAQLVHFSKMNIIFLFHMIKTGHADEALETFDEAWKTAEKCGANADSFKRQMMHLKGIAFLALGDVEEAQECRDSLKDLIDSGKNRKAYKLYYHLSGLIEMQKGNLSEALEHFNMAKELTPHEFLGDDSTYLKNALFLESLGDVYLKMGELDKAIEQFESLQSLTLGRFYHSDIYAKSYYKLGNIYEQKGWEGKAIENYEKFLDLWKDADPGIAEVEDAKKRLNELK